MLQNKRTRSIIGQIQDTFRAGEKLSATLGLVTGAFAPTGVFAITHGCLTEAPLYVQPLAWIAGGGLVFSAMTVVTWANTMFRNPVKAVGWTLLIEGIMTFAPHQLLWLSYGCLALLVFVNAVANACNLVADKNRELGEEREEAEEAARMVKAEQDRLAAIEQHRAEAEKARKSEQRKAAREAKKQAQVANDTAPSKRRASGTRAKTAA
jgi:hypothetical protein